VQATRRSAPSRAVSFTRRLPAGKRDMAKDERRSIRGATRRNPGGGICRHCPAPFAAMLLSDMGAEVIRIDRKGGRAPRSTDVTFRGRRAIAFDMKKTEAVDATLRLVKQADALIEGFPSRCHGASWHRPGRPVSKRNPRLVYGRMTGWGQTGPLACAAGHDINYIALTGALHAIGSAGGKAGSPLNLAGDFGGGALYLAFGLICGVGRIHALRQRAGGRRSDDRRRASLMSMFYGMAASGMCRTNVE